MSETVVSVTDVCKSFSGKKALDGLSLTLGKGEIMGFLGANGAGKTTTIKILLGFIKPDSGCVSVFGRAPDAPETRSRIGYLPEIAYYYPFLTIRELLEFYGGVSGMSRKDIALRAPTLIKRVGLENAGDKYLKAYSKGMLQRAGIAQALLHDPDILILDEPFTGLDPLARSSFRELLAELRDSGKTIFFSSHELSEAETICDHVAIVRDGKVVLQGGLKDIIGDGSENLERIFLKFLGEKPRM